MNLAEPEADSFALTEQDDSIRIHICHSALRQLEVLKDQLTFWLSEATADAPRSPSDILVLSPNLKDLEPLIRSVFAPPPREQFFDDQAQADAARKDSVYLPVKIAGVAPLDVQNAWQAVLGPIQLPQGRFTLEDFADWLNLSAAQTRYGINADQSARMIELLSEAKFKRGLDQEHLARTLAPNDTDYRYSFKFALDRLALGVAVSEHAMWQDTLSYAFVRRDDFELVNILIEIYQDFAERRHWIVEHEMGQLRNVEEWLHLLLRDLERYQKQGVTVLKSVRDAIRKQITMLTLSYYQEEDANAAEHSDVLKDMQLPLPYVLQEIQSTLDSQMDQAVPSGQITFSQIGQIRPVPYKLIVMLNLDSGQFPSRKSHLPFDLMDVLKPHLGDRSRLEDDQGAFLDALLLAKDNLWLFYNGFDINDGEIREPSSVLQEFIRHLALIVQGSSANPNLPVLAKIEGDVPVPANLQSIYSVHELQPFELHGFDAQRSSGKIRYQDHWFYVARQLQQAQGSRQPWAAQAVTLQAPVETLLDSAQWIKQVTFPAELYLKSLGISNLRTEDGLATDEPLLLDGLEQYAVRHFLQDQSVKNESSQAVQPELLLDQLPVGKFKDAAWSVSQLQHEQLWQRVQVLMQPNSPELTAVTQRQLKVDDQTLMQITVPEQPVQQWLSMTPSSARGRRRAQIWLEYLLWLASLPTDAPALNYERIEVCNDVTIRCSGIQPEDARVHLARWMQAWRYGQQQPLVLPAALMLATDKNSALILQEGKKGEDLEVKWQENEHGVQVLQQFDKLIAKWADPGDYAAFDVRQDEANQAHADWAFILRDQNSLQLLTQSCEQFAYALYAPIYSHQTAEQAHAD